MTRALALLMLLGLAGCNSVGDRIVIPAPVIIHDPSLSKAIPKALLACKDEPLGNLVKTNGDAGNYILDLRVAGRDCRNKLNAVRNIVRGITPSR